MHERKQLSEEGRPQTGADNHSHSASDKLTKHPPLCSGIRGPQPPAALKSGGESPLGLGPLPSSWTRLDLALPEACEGSFLHFTDEETEAQGG